MRLLGLVASLSLVLPACLFDGPLSNPAFTTCVDDAECMDVDARHVCVIGICVDPDNTALDQVHLEVRPLDDSGYRPQQLLEVQHTSENGRTEILLRPTVNVHGNLVDEVLGTAIPSQVVAVQQDGIPGRALVVTTDVEGVAGAFSLPLVERDSYTLSFWPSDGSRPPLFWRSPGRGASGAYQVTASATGDRSLQAGPVMLPSTDALLAVSGRVVAGVGTAVLGVEGLEVRILDGKRRVSSLGRTDTQGAFELKVTPEAAESVLVLEVRSTDQNRLNPTVQVPNLLLDGDTVLPDVELGELSSPVPFAGVVNGPDGQPVAQANIFVHGALGAGTFTTLITTDDEGRYDSELRPARYDFVVVAPTSNPTAGLLAGFSAEVGYAAPPPVLNLPERQLVSGHVVDDVGAAVGNATVHMTRISAVGGLAEPLLAGLGWSFSAVTDAEGRWQERVDPGRYRVVILPDASTTRPRHTQLVDVDVEHTSHSFQLKPSSVVAGVVSGVGDEPLGMSTVTAYAPLVGESGAAIELGSAQTKADGSFEILLPVLDP